MKEYSDLFIWFCVKPPQIIVVALKQIFYWLLLFSPSFTDIIQSYPGFAFACQFYLAQLGNIRVRLYFIAGEDLNHRTWSFSVESPRGETEVGHGLKRFQIPDSRGGAKYYCDFIYWWKFSSLLFCKICANVKPCIPMTGQTLYLESIKEGREPNRTDISTISDLLQLWYSFIFCGINIVFW